MINVVLKSFPDHAGRPGLQGGSLPRGIRNSQDAAVIYHDHRNLSPHGIYTFTKYKGDKVIVFPDGVMIRSRFGPGTHTQILARFVLDNPSVYDKKTIKIAEDIELYNSEEDSRFERIVMNKNPGMLKFDSAFYPYAGNIFTVVGQDANDIGKSFQLVKRMFKSGIIDIADIEKISMHFDSSFVSIDVNKLDEISGITMDDVYHPTIHYKESKVVRLKGGEGSGFHGHKGIPGHQGGSLPNKFIDVDANNFYSGLIDRFGQDTEFSISNDFENETGTPGTGVYDPDKNKIILNVKYTTLMDSDNGTNPSGNITNLTTIGWKFLLAHEYGHAFDFVLNSSVSLKDGWRDIIRKYNNDHEFDIRNGNYSNNDSIISIYTLSIGYSKYTESFAEAFAAYVLRPSWLIDKNPDMYKFIENLEIGREKEFTKNPFIEMIEVYTNEEFVWIPAKKKIVRNITVLKGGEGSGFHGHAGRIGKVGGSSADTFMKLPAGTRIVKPGSEAMRGSYWLLPDKRLVEIPIGMEHATFARAFLMLNNHPDAFEDTLFRQGGIRISVWLDTYFELHEFNDKTFREIQDLYLSKTLVKPAWTTEITFDDKVSEAGMTTFNYDEFLSADGIKLTRVGGVRDWELVLKESKIVVRLKGGEGSGHYGHRGRPGKQGGGLPDGIIPEYSPTNNDFGRYLRSNSKLRSQVIKKIDDYYKTLGYSYDVDRLDTEFDVIMLDKTRFDRYNEKWNLKLPDDMYQKLATEVKEVEREELKARIKYQDSMTVKDSTGYVNFLASTGMRISEVSLFGNDITDARRELSKYPFYVDTGNLSEDRAHRFLSNIIRAIDKFPEVKMLVSKGAVGRVTYDPTKRIGTAAGSAARRNIEIYEDEFGYGTSANVFCHELGHVALDFAYENNIVTGTIGDIFGTGKKVSSYAWTNYDEDYAESFVAFISKNKMYLEDPELDSKMTYIGGNLRSISELGDKQ